MNLLNRMLGHLFPVMAISGLLLAGWGLIVTPDEIKADAQSTMRGAQPSLSLPSMDVASN